MFADLDETIRQLLIKKVPIDLSEVELSFEAPDREWSGRLSRPTVNCFLYDVRENLDLRQVDWEVQKKNGSATTRRMPARIDATYQVTVWTRAPEDEHRLLWRVLVALFRTPVIAEELLQGQLRNQVFPTRAVVVQPSQARANPAELWQAVDNRIRPALTYTVTVPLDLELEYTSPMVFTQRLRVFGREDDRPAPAEVGAPKRAPGDRADEDEAAKQRWLNQKAAETVRILGHVRDRSDRERALKGVTVLLRETGARFITDTEGRFAFTAHEGPITLTATAPDGEQTSRQVEVPALEYDLEL